MDNRAWKSAASATPPSAPVSPSMGYPSEGNPATATPATTGGAFWFHMIGEELRAVLAAAGITPDHTNLTQLLTSINALIEARVGDYSLDTGTANAKVVALNPVLAAYAGNFTGVFKNAVLNTGACTIDFGPSAVPLVMDTGGALAGGDLPAGAVIGYQYIHADGKAYVTSLVTSQGDARYAKLAGLLTQVFEAGDGATGKQVVNISQFSKSLGTSGYMKLPGGLVLQWGGTTVTGGTPLTVTLPLAFTTAYIVLNNLGSGPGTIPSGMAYFLSGSQIVLNHSSVGNAWLTGWFALGTI